VNILILNNENKKSKKKKKIFTLRSMKQKNGHRGYFQNFLKNEKLSFPLNYRLFILSLAYVAFFLFSFLIM